MVAWVPDRPSKLGVMPREGTAADVRWFEMEPRHMFHEFNMREDGDTIVADVATAAGTALFPDVNGRVPTHAETAPSLRGRHRGGPVATVVIPFRVPSGFHCNYYSADSALYRETLD